MRKKHIVIFSLLDTLHYSDADRKFFSQLYFLMKQGYEVVLATNNSAAEKDILSKLTTQEKKKFHVIIAPYHLNVNKNWKAFFKFLVIAPNAYIWCDTTVKHLKRDYDEVICLWKGFSDRLAFSRAAKQHKGKLIWIESSPLDSQFGTLKKLSQFLYRITQKYPDHVIATSPSILNSLLKQTKFRRKEITLIQETKIASGKKHKKNNLTMLHQIIKDLTK